MAGKFVLRKTGKDRFRFNLKAPNGQVILTSETYNNRSSAMNGIESVRRNAGREGNFERRSTKNGQPYFVLKAPNHEVIGQSETYSASGSVSKGIASVKTNARTARVEDLTGQ